MTGERLASVIESVSDRPDAESGQTSDARTVLVVSCGLDGPGPDQPLWPADTAWTVIDVDTLGNQVCDRETDAGVDSGLAHIAAQHDIAAAVVIGHTGCEVVQDAYDRWAAPSTETPAGVERRLAPLVALVRDAFETGLFDAATPLGTVHHRLVEYNVAHQVRTLHSTLEPSVTVAGYVHDEEGVYGAFPGDHHLVALNDAADPAAIRARLPEEAAVRPASLLP